MSERKPWFCPSCQKHHGPHVDTCPAPSLGIYAPPVQMIPASGWEPDPCAHCKGACGNVACPKRSNVTSYMTGAN